MAISADAGSIVGATAQSPVLRVIVENLFYPVTLDVLHQVQADFVVWQSHYSFNCSYHRLARFLLIFKQALYFGKWALK